VLKPNFMLGVVIVTVIGCSRAVLTPQVQVGPAITTSTSTYMHLLEQGWEYSVSESDLADSPAWPDPFRDAVPLSVAQALSISRGEPVKYMPNVDTWDLAGIKLEPIGYESKWLYVVSWRPRGLKEGDNLDIPVLMSGRAIQLVRNP